MQPGFLGCFARPLLRAFLGRLLLHAFLGRLLLDTRYGFLIEFEAIANDDFLSFHNELIVFISDEVAVALLRGSELLAIFRFFFGVD